MRAVPMPPASTVPTASAMTAAAIWASQETSAWEVREDNRGHSPLVDTSPGTIYSSFVLCFGFY